MSPRLKVYLAAVWIAAVILMALYLPPDLSRLWVHYVAWTLVCYAAETMWFPTGAGGGTISVASTANLAALLLWGPHAAMWMAAVSTLLANIFIQKKPLERGTFNAAQMTITMWVAGLVAVKLGVPANGFQGGPAPQGTGDWISVLPAFFATVAAYFLVNSALVSAAIAWSSHRGFWQVMANEFFVRERMFDNFAPFLLIPPVVVCFHAVQYLGLLMFYVPLRIIYESALRYVELRNAQKMLIHSERMAAKGEMAAEIGHELRNQLVAVSGRAQMLLREADREQYGNVRRHSQIILEQARRVEAMSKGLMDFSRAELKVEKVDLNALVQRSVEFVRPQNRFDAVEWDLRLANHIPTLRADPGQLQQVLLNLYINAADAMCEHQTSRRVIATRTEYDDRKRLVRLTVSDSGPGIPPALLGKVFEPHFTTKAEGHGFGLYASYRIVTNHGGQIVVESEPSQGARFTITLPLHGPGGWS